VPVRGTGGGPVAGGRPGRLPGGPPVLGGWGVRVSMGTPHVVVPLPGPAELAALDLPRPREVSPPLPAGQNVEFVVRRGPRQLALRVHERGVGETRSCGTGVCAAVVATIHGSRAAPRSSAQRH